MAKPTISECVEVMTYCLKVKDNEMSAKTNRTFVLAIDRLLELFEDCDKNNLYTHQQLEDAKTHAHNVGHRVGGSDARGPRCET